MDPFEMDTVGRFESYLEERIDILCLNKDLPNYEESIKLIYNDVLRQIRTSLGHQVVSRWISRNWKWTDADWNDDSEESAELYRLAFIEALDGGFFDVLIEDSTSRLIDSFQN